MHEGLHDSDHVESMTPFVLTLCCPWVQLDDVMGTANAVAGNVKEQSNLFENIGDKVVTLGSKFPAVNAVLNAVRRKKSKVRPAISPQVCLAVLSCAVTNGTLRGVLSALQDTIILLSVVVVCTLLILIYWINK